MQLDKFKKNQKLKNTLLTLGIFAILGGAILVYRTYALYQEEKDYNVIRGIVPDFGYDLKLAIYVDGKKQETLPTERNYYVNIKCDNDINAEWDYDNWRPIIPNILKTTKCNIEYESINKFEKLKEKVGVSATDINDLLENNIDKLVNSKEGMLYLAKSPELVTNLKNSTNYTNDVKQKILDAEVVDENTKYVAGLPCYLLKNGKATNVVNDFKIGSVSTGASFQSQQSLTSWLANDDNLEYIVDYMDTIVTIMSRNYLNITNYTNLSIYFGHATNYKDNTLSGTLKYRLNNNELNTYTFNNGNNQTEYTKLEADISSYTGIYGLYIDLIHGDEIGAHTINFYLKNITLT